MSFIQGHNAFFAALAQGGYQLLRFLEFLIKLVVLSPQQLCNLRLNLGLKRIAQCINALNGAKLHVTLTSAGRRAGARTGERCRVKALCQPGRLVAPAYPQPHINRRANKNNASNQPAHALNTAHCGQAGQSGNYYYLKRNAHICLP